jgi:lipopolysaccharide export system protein LptA
MRVYACLLALSLVTGAVAPAWAKSAHVGAQAAAPTGGGASQIDISADKSLEWYQEKNMYVARGNATAIRGDTTVNADLLTAHERPKPAKDAKAAPGAGMGDKKQDSSGDIDKMTAEGHVVITKPGAVVSGDNAVDDVDKHVMVVTGKNLRYETNNQIVTAQDSLEYWDTAKMAVARGHAVAVKGDRHVEGDVLTAEFRTPPAGGADQLTKMTAQGHVTVITKNDVTRGDKAVYDAARDIAIVSGHVRITRGDGTELTGDVGESDFAANQSRLMNDGSGRVRALLPARSSSPGTKSKQTGSP